MANIPIGTKGESQLLVTSEVAIDFMGTEGARALHPAHDRVLNMEYRKLLKPLTDQWHG
jgi:hypothetical protein